MFYVCWDCLVKQKAVVRLLLALPLWSCQQNSTNNWIPVLEYIYCSCHTFISSWNSKWALTAFRKFAIQALTWASARLLNYGLDPMNQKSSWVWNGHFLEPEQKSMLDFSWFRLVSQGSWTMPPPEQWLNFSRLRCSASLRIWHF